jgi:hypothetical protein
MGYKSSIIWNFSACKELLRAYGFSLCPYATKFGYLMNALHNCGIMMQTIVVKYVVLSNKESSI